MRKMIIVAIVTTATVFPQRARADFWGGDIPLLVEIVANTLNTLNELQLQSDLLRKDLRGIDDTIHRLQAIRDLAKPEDFPRWKNPQEAIRRLREIYGALPDKLKNEKSREIERQLSNAMSLSAALTQSAKPAFESGRELETRALDVGPAVAQKMGASGIGTLVTLESQNQVAQATVVSLLSQMIAEEGSKEVSHLKSQSSELGSAGRSLRASTFSSQIILPEARR